MAATACKQVLRDLYRILEEGHPTDVRCRQIRSHLDTCSACANRFRELDALALICGRIPPPELSESRKRSLKKRLRASLAVSR